MLTLVFELKMKEETLKIEKTDHLTRLSYDLLSHHINISLNRNQINSKSQGGEAK